jgi:hypothetical protein
MYVCSYMVMYESLSLSLSLSLSYIKILKYHFLSHEECVSCGVGFFSYSLFLCCVCVCFLSKYKRLIMFLVPIKLVKKKLVHTKKGMFWSYNSIPFSALIWSLQFIKRDHSLEFDRYPINSKFRFKIKLILFKGKVIVIFNTVQYTF